MMNLSLRYSVVALLVLCATTAQAARLPVPSASERRRANKNSVSEFEPPSFYNGKEGPEFRLEVSGESYDERVYMAATWAATKVTDTKLDKAFKEGSSRLDNFRKGGNENGTKWDATVPTFVLLNRAPTGRAFESDFVVHTFVPKDLQEVVPKPDAEEVEVKELPEQKIYVKTFGGYAFEDAVLDQTFDFLDELKEAGVSVDSLKVAFAQYDGPLKVLGRHNEIWAWDEQAPSAAAKPKRSQAKQAAVAGDDEDQWESPSWCYSKDCPKFAVKETAADGAELREYRPSRWLAANFTDIDYSKAVEKGAEKIKAYRDGENNLHMKVGLTSPSSFAILYPTPSAQPAISARYSIQSYLPYELQEQAAPQPTAEKVALIDVPSQLVWVKVVGGFLQESDIVKAAFNFREELQKAEKEIDFEYFASAGFDPVTTLLNRHNEVWLFVKAPAPTVASKPLAWAAKQVQQLQQLRRNAAFP
ncbi:MAG: hypothetical protein WDW36_007925 [Sanguina aurantia]